MECNRQKEEKSEMFNNDINAVTISRKKKEEQGKSRLVQHKANIIQEDETLNTLMLGLYSQHDNLLLEIECLKENQRREIESQKERYYLDEKAETDEYNKKMSKLEGSLNKTRSTYEYSMKSNDEMMAQKDEENEILKEKERAKLDIELAEDEERGIDLRKKNNRLLSEILRYNYRNKELAVVMVEIEGEIEELFVEKKEHEDSLKNIAKVLSQQDNMINHSEKKAKEYLKKNIV